MSAAASCIQGEAGQSSPETDASDMVRRFPFDDGDGSAAGGLRSDDDDDDDDAILDENHGWYAHLFKQELETLKGAWLSTQPQPLCASGLKIPEKIS